MMELSELHNNVILDKNRVNLYYDKYKYKVILFVPLIHYFRYVSNQTQYEKRLEDYLKVWTANQRPTQTAHALKDLISQNSPDNIKKFSEIIAWRESTKNNVDIKWCTKYDSLEIYTSELEIIKNLLNTLARYGTKSKIYYAEKIPNFTGNTIYHKFPKFKKRIYLKFRKLSDSDADSFNTFLKNYDFKCSPSLYKSLNNIRSNIGVYGRFNLKRLILEHFYVDINDDYLLTMLSLTYPDLIRKVCTIEKR